MIKNTNMGFELKLLLSNLSGHGVQHLTEIESDLAQTNFLLGEAIEKLSASFMAIHAAVSAQQQAVDAMLAGAAPTPELSEDIKSKQAEVARHIGAAVTGLQFQDMTSQLIGRTVKRVNGLRDVLSDVGAGSSVMPEEGGSEEIIRAIGRINQTMEEKSAKLDGELWKAVCQTHMESGDIELF